MLKRENEFEKNKKIEEMKNQYNLDELFEKIVLKEDDEKEMKNSLETKKD